MRFSRFVVVAVVGMANLLAVNFSQAAVSFSVFVDPHVNPAVTGGTIGFAYAGNKFVGTVQKDGTGAMYSTDLTGGSVALFAPTVSLAPNPSSEHFVSSSLGLGGFPNRDIYVANANGIMHITNDGSSSDLFLTGLGGAVRGILFDSVGTFGNDMLITTNSGQVYRVNSAGSASLLASVGEDTEGLDIAPAGFGPYGGQLIVASEGSGAIRAINTLGSISFVAAVSSAEELTFVPLNLGASGNPVEGFYGANYTPNVLKGDVSEFTSFLGDAIVTGETTHLVSNVHWDGTNFVVSTIGSFPDQPEDGIFVTADIINPGGVPEPASVIVWSVLGLACASFSYRRRLRSV